MKKIVAFGFAITLAGLCGCVYHPTITQGNVLTPVKMQSIQIGMTSAQVVEKLGSPVLKNVYADDHVAYIYTTQATHQKMVIKKLEIDFKNDRVTNVRTWL